LRIVRNVHFKSEQKNESEHAGKETTGLFFSVFPVLLRDAAFGGKKVTLVIRRPKPQTIRGTTTYGEHSDHLPRTTDPKSLKTIQNEAIESASCPSLDNDIKAQEISLSPPQRLRSLTTRQSNTRELPCSHMLYVFLPSLYSLSHLSIPLQSHHPSRMSSRISNSNQPPEADKMTTQRPRSAPASLTVETKHVCFYQEEKHSIYIRCHDKRHRGYSAILKGSPIEGLGRINIGDRKALSKPVHLTYKGKAHYYSQRIKHTITGMYPYKKWAKYADSKEGEVPHRLPEHLRPLTSSAMENSSTSFELLEVELPSSNFQDEMRAFTRISTPCD